MCNMYMSGGRNCYTFHSRSRVIVFTDDFVEVYLCNRKDKEMVLQPIGASYICTLSQHSLSAPPPPHFLSLPTFFTVICIPLLHLLCKHHITYFASLYLSLSTLP